jgi:hypothetical protein
MASKTRVLSGGYDDNVVVDAIGIDDIDVLLLIVDKELSFVVVVVVVEDTSSANDDVYKDKGGGEADNVVTAGRSIETSIECV